MCNRDGLAAHLVEILRALVFAADEAGVDLDEAANRNVTKTLSRWMPQDRRTLHHCSIRTMIPRNVCRDASK